MRDSNKEIVGDGGLGWHFLKEGTRYTDNLLADLNIEDGTGFRNFARMVPTNF
jgi:hypothetical protein